MNLAHGVEVALAAFARDGAVGALRAAEEYAAADVRANRALGVHGAALVPRGARVLTHCNAGALACVGYGTALGVIRAAAERGKQPMVWVDETRPVLQGARLTAWELGRLGIPHTLVVDGAANGDVANKIGTYSLAVLARHHGVPFVVAAPIATIDLATPNGDAIVVEDRAGEEVTAFGGITVAPRAVAVANPAFDVTPARLVHAIVTELGVVTRPTRRVLATHVAGAEKRPGPE